MLLWLLLLAAAVVVQVPHVGAQAGRDCDAAEDAHHRSQDQHQTHLKYN